MAAAADCCELNNGFSEVINTNVSKVLGGHVLRREDWRFQLRCSFLPFFGDEEDFG